MSRVNELQNEAFEFACHLLVPTEMLFDRIREYHPYITSWDLARLFGVERRIIKYKLQEEGIYFIQ